MSWCYLNLIVVHICASSQKPLVQVPGLEAGAVGIELTSFTKKDTTVGESEEQQRTHTEESQSAESTIRTETGQEQVRVIILGIIFMAIKLFFISQLEKSEVGTKGISQPEIEQSLNQHRVPTSIEEYEGKVTKVTESAKPTAAAESVSINFCVHATNS